MARLQKTRLFAESSEELRLLRDKIKDGVLLDGALYPVDGYSRALVLPDAIRPESAQHLLLAFAAAARAHSTATERRKKLFVVKT